MNVDYAVMLQDPVLGDTSSTTRQIGSCSEFMLCVLTNSETSIFLDSFLGSIDSYIRVNGY
jgi:hypothetical protein